MTIEQILYLNTDTVQYHTQQLVKRKTPYLIHALHKIDQLHQQATQGNAYAMVALYQLHQQLNQRCKKLESIIRRIKAQLKRHSSGISLNYPKTHPQRLRFREPLGYRLICMISRWDEMLYWVRLAACHGAFYFPKTGDNLQGNEQKRCLQLLSSVVYQRSYRMPFVNVRDVLEQSKRYGKGVEVWGDMSLKRLAEAVFSAVTPGVSEDLQEKLILLIDK